MLPLHLNSTHKNGCPDRRVSSAKRLIGFHLEFGEKKQNHRKYYQTLRNTFFFDGTKIGLFGLTLSIMFGVNQVAVHRLSGASTVTLRGGSLMLWV